MKTATVTWITYNNYGTLLQAYALQRYIQLLGHENEIIADKLILREFQEKNRRPAVKKARVVQQRTLKERIVGILQNPRRIERILLARFDREKLRAPYYDMIERCEEFKKEELCILEGCTVESLPSLNQTYDAFICGSDQIWSVFPEIFNSYYYLDFVEKKKISYAPSLGSDSISEQIENRVKELLSDFDEISVREYASARYLESLCGRRVEWVCDPTLLHDSAFWHHFAEGTKRPRAKFLLCYFLDNKPWYFEMAKKIAREMHLRIQLIPNRWEYTSNENVIKYAVGPKEFVGLFENAEFVLTDSYHGSIFSLIFQRRFLYLKRFSKDDPNSQNIRIESLFSYLEIRKYILDDMPSSYPLMNNDDFDRISRLLAAFREKSQLFLSNSLCNENART